MLRRPRYYADTSVFGGCFDSEFRTDSLEFFSLIRSKQAVFLVSPTLVEELSLAPQEVQELLDTLPDEALEPVDDSADAIILLNACIESGALTK